MANPFVKGWRYMMALFGAKIDEYADPKVQIQQAIEDAQRQHQALVQQAAAVIGNQRQLEMKLSRQMSEVEKLQSSARQALVLADKARADGDEEKATQYESAAQTFATQLVSGEQSMEDLKTLHDQALSAADAGAQGGREQRDGAAAEAGRADQAAEPARAGEDAGDRGALAGGHERARRARQHAVAGRGAREDRAPVRQRDGPGRARLELRRGPHARGAEVHPRHGRIVAAGADPGEHGRRPTDRWR